MKVKKHNGGSFWDGWCDNCDFRSEFITGSRVKAEAKAHAGATGHTTRVRFIEYTDYRKEPL